jgi:flagellar biosynthetic protein FliR
MTGFDLAAGLALLLVRPGMIVMATPFFGALNAPTQIRVGLTLLLAVLMAMSAPVPASRPATGLAVVILREIAIGLAIAMAVRVLIGAAEFAGHFIGYQIGLSLGSLIDPQSGVRNNILAMLYANVVVVLCLATNVHHTLIRALRDSYTALPIGFGAIGGSLVSSVADLLGVVFMLGLRISAPVVVVLVLVEFALGLLARVAPSLNVIIAGAPVRIVAGLLVLAASLVGLPALLSRYVPTVFERAAGLAAGFR